MLSQSGQTQLRLLSASTFIQDLGIHALVIFLP